MCELYLKHLKKLFSFFFSPFKHTAVSLLAFHSEEVETSVQLLSCVWLFATPWTAARQASLSITNFWSLPKLMSIELVLPSNHLILCCPPLLPPSVFPSIRVFLNVSALCIRWPKYWNFGKNLYVIAIVALFVIVRNWKGPEFFAVGAWLRQLCCIHRGAALAVHRRWLWSISEGRPRALS